MAKDNVSTKGTYVYEWDFSTGNTNPETYPSDDLVAAATKAIPEMGSLLNRYHGKFGHEGLRQLMAQREMDREGVAVDYEHPALGATFKAHLDANVADAQYTSTTDPTLSDKSFTMNGRLTLADIHLAEGSPALQLSVWSRNLTNESYAFLRNYNAALGTYAIFNEPRTFGVEADVKF